MLDTSPYLVNTDFPAIKREALSTLQVNLGYLCNLSCTHCHVNAGPKRTELASRETVDYILAFVENSDISVLDLTGGAPEMNPHFRYMVLSAKEQGVEVIDRCNLTILNEPGYEDLASFLADNEVRVSASLPCYLEKNVSEQRGKGVFESSIQALQKLNMLGYGGDENKKLDLVYNPNGVFLPPDQKMLEASYKEHLFESYGVVFNELLTITNMPINRFGSMLLSKNKYSEYMDLLKDNYSSSNLQSVMCKSLISVDWRGYVYDCDFNQMLNWPMRLDKDLIASDKTQVHISDLLHTTLDSNGIMVGEHCFACTAGQGSSCGGALS